MKAQIRGCQIFGFKRDKYKCNRRIYSFVTGVDGTTEQSEGSVSPEEEGYISRRQERKHQTFNFKDTDPCSQKEYKIHNGVNTAF